jgi:acyl carrier protein
MSVAPAVPVTAIIFGRRYGQMTTEQEVIVLVSKKTGRPESSITPEMTFYQLGLDGDDAVELIDELCRRYKVPAETIDLNKYIGPEGGGVFNHILYALSRKNKSSQEHKELRISDLIKTAIDRRWFDQPV